MRIVLDVDAPVRAFRSTSVPARGECAWSDGYVAAACNRKQRETNERPRLHFHPHKDRSAFMHNVATHARNLVDQGQYDQACEAYRAALAKEPEDRNLLFAFSSLLVKMNRHVEAIPICERLAAYWRGVRFHNHAVFFYVQAYAYFFLHAPHRQDHFGHLPQRLAEVFKEICATEGQITQNAVRDALATQAEQEDFKDAVIDLLGKVIAIDPDNPFPHQCRLDVFVRLRHSHHADEQRRILDELLAGDKHTR